MISRRRWLGYAGALGVLSRAGLDGAAQKPDARKRVPIIDITDLYHPPQDPGDNFDLIAAYAIPTVDLRAIVLDATAGFRGLVAKDNQGKVLDANGPREPGIIPVSQLNYIFNRNVPYGVGPLTPLKSPGDAKLDAPGFEQTGIELILRTLRESSEKVDILSFGSARALAAAWNRQPDLLPEKVNRIHLSAGASAPTFQEWNVALDPHAIVALIRSNLPIALYPCATKDGPFEYGRYNTFWKLLNLDFIRKMDPRLQRYLAYAFTRSSRIDFLRPWTRTGEPQIMDHVCGRTHNVWETAIWAEVAGLRLVRRNDGAWRLIHAAELGPSDVPLPATLRPCTASARPDGNYSFALTSAAY